MIAAAPLPLSPLPRPGLWRALAVTVVPDARALDAAGWRELEEIVAEALAERPQRLRRQLAAFLGLLHWLPVLRWLRPFEALDPLRRAAVLRSLQRAPLLALRRGIWGVRTLVLMGYYGREAAAAEIGYRADPRGWAARVEGGAA